MCFQEGAALLELELYLVTYVDTDGGSSSIAAVAIKVGVQECQFALVFY